MALRITGYTGKLHLGRPRSRFEDNMKIHLKEIYINTRNLVKSAQDRDIGDPLSMRH